MIAYIVWLSIAIDVVYCGVIVANVEAKVGDNVTLSCHTDVDNQVRWSVANRAQSIRTVIQSGNRHRVRSGNGFWNLSITRVVSSDNGTYFCTEETLNSRVESSVNLVVYAPYEYVVDVQSVTGDYLWSIIVACVILAGQIALSLAWWIRLITNQPDDLNDSTLELDRPRIVKERIVLLYDSLIKIMTVDNGMLNCLTRRQILTQSEFVRIAEYRNYDKKCRMVLKYSLKRCSDNCKELLSCMEENGQKHVVHFVESNGVASAKYGNCWPLDLKYITLLNDIRDELIDRLVITDTMLDYMNSTYCITTDQCDRIRNVTDVKDRNKMIIEKLMRGSNAHFNRFVGCVHEMQPELLTLLHPIESDNLLSEHVMST